MTRKKRLSRLAKQRRITGGSDFWDFQSSVGRASASYDRFGDNIMGYLFYIIGFMFIVGGVYEVVKGKAVDAKQPLRADTKVVPPPERQIREEGFVFIEVGVIFMIVGHASIWTGKYVDKQVRRSKSTAAMYGTWWEAGFLYNLFNSN